MLRLALEAAPAAMLMVDSRGTVVFVNALTERVFGYARDELVGQPVDRLVPGRLRGEHSGHRAVFFGASRQRPMGAGQELYAVRKDGSEVPVEIGLSPIDTHEGRFVIAAVTDIAAHREAQQALREADRRKDEFLAMLSHELRNPLGAITNAAHLLKQLGSPQSDHRWARDVIDRQTAHLARIVDDLLDVSRISRAQVVLHREPMPLGSAVALALETARPLMEGRRQKYTSSVPLDPVWVDADATRLSQAIANLLVNASRYTSREGSIMLTMAREGKDAVVRVQDTGIGISAEMLPRIFDLFVQAERLPDEAPGGLGLGLTLARRLTEMHGGTLEVHSEGPGRGSEFVLRLPAFQGVLPTAGHTRPVLVYEAIQRRILVVDDNPDAADALALNLGATGHQVRVVSDGPAALDMAREFKPEVVLLDLGLPGMDGYEVGRRLKAEPGLGSFVLIAITGYGREEDRHRTQAAGFDHHLVKPVTAEAILAVLNQPPAPPPSAPRRHVEN
jgi:PAS domain S-box-containing protein